MKDRNHLSNIGLNHQVNVISNGLLDIPMLQILQADGVPQTIRTDMLPAFRDGRYGPGLVAGTTRVIERIARGRGVTLENVALPAARQPRAPDGGPSIGTIVLILLVLVMMSRFGGMGGSVLPSGRRGGRSTWSGWHGGLGGFGGGFGGGGGGGFGGFGGGRSGGGGASGGW
jgi:uncharacterized protein